MTLTSNDRGEQLISEVYHAKNHIFFLMEQKEFILKSFSKRFEPDSDDNLIKIDSKINSLTDEIQDKLRRATNLLDNPLEIMNVFKVENELH